MGRKFVIVDLFSGAGGASHSAVRAVKSLGGEIGRFVAVNHWQAAVATHTANHPDAEHYCMKVGTVRPEEAVPGKVVDLLLAGPSCTHHSRARGSAPIEDQLRYGPWEILQWASSLTVKNLLIENVPDLLDWGPLGANGKPLKSRKGETFRAYIAAIEGLGYNVEWRILNAADYGDATSRERLFILARRKNLGTVTWPEPTHQSRKELARAQRQPSLFPTRARKPHRGAAEIIDWSLLGESIWNREKPLAAATMKRILAGLWKYGLQGLVDESSVDKFVAPKGAEAMTAALIQLNRHCDARSLAEPVPTQTTANHFGLAEYLRLPDPTDWAPGRLANHPLANLLRRPTPAPQIRIGTPYLVTYYGTGQALSINEPLDTVTTRDRFGLCVPILDIAGAEQRRLYVDILFRMLQPHEAAAAMSFPRDYRFVSGRPIKVSADRRLYTLPSTFDNCTMKDAVKMIGNAWAGNTGYALARAQLRGAG